MEPLLGSTALHRADLRPLRGRGGRERESEGRRKRERERKREGGREGGRKSTGVPAVMRKLRM